MILTELFDAPKKRWKVTADTSTEWTASVKLKNRKSLEVIAQNQGHYWGLDFTVDGDLDATGDGNQFEVFALVAEMLRTFKSKKHPEFIAMEASEENRSKLYERMLKRELKGWTVERYYDESSYLYVLLAGENGPFPTDGYDGDLVDPSNRNSGWGDEAEI